MFEVDTLRKTFYVIKSELKISKSTYRCFGACLRFSNQKSFARDVRLIVIKLAICIANFATWNRLVLEQMCVAVNHSERSMFQCSEACILPEGEWDLMAPRLTFDRLVDRVFRVIFRRGTSSSSSSSFA